MHRRLHFLIILILVVAIQADAQFGSEIAADPVPHTNPAIASRATTYIETLTLEQKVAQLFFIRAYGEPFKEESAAFKRLRQRVEEQYIGGIVFFKGNSQDQITLTNRLQELAPIPLLIAQDMEFGTAMRVDDGTRISPAMGVAATGNPQNAFDMGRITALEAKAIGVHHIYAPVVDVNNNPSNPVINLRSFSENPDLVSTYSAAFIRGVSSVGLLSTAKHFPGHGDTENDSHFTLPVIRHTYERLDTLELPPFRNAIKAGVSSVMSAHIAFPELSKNPKIPGTLDPDVLHRLLVDSLGFKGLILSDALEMRGVTSVLKPGEAAVAALKAGVDLIILSPDETTAIKAVVAAVEKGDIQEDRIDASLQKMMSWKIQLGLFDNKYSDAHAARSIVGAREFKLTSDRIARESITLLKNDGNLLPLSASRQSSIVLLALTNDASGQAGAELARQMRLYHPNIAFHTISPRTNQRQQQTALQEIRRADAVVVAAYFNTTMTEQKGTPGPLQRFMMQVDQLKKPAILLSLAVPYHVVGMPNADVHLGGWSGNTQHAPALASALFGAAPVQGVLPIGIPDVYRIGTGISLPQSILRQDEPEAAGMNPVGIRAIDEIMENAISEEVFPGASVAIIRKGVLVHHAAYGHHTYEKKRAVQVDDIFDMASLTKVMATTSAVMRLVSEGKLSVNDRVSKYIPEYATPEKQGITIRQMLLHEAGLPAFRVYVDKLKTRKEVLKAVLEEPLINRPGTQYIYSDLGFITLAEIVERITKMRFDDYVQKEIFQPLNMFDTRFRAFDRIETRPADLAKAIERILPTEIDTIYRKKTIHGEAHDERAWYMDGLAGHAGLFSTSKDVARYASMLLNFGTYNTYSVADSTTTALFTARQSVLAKRGYGFDMKTASGFSSAGSLMGATTFGHTGFTGTSVWIDRDLELAVVVLTNRTWPYRGTSGAIGRVRAAVADAAVNAITKE